MWHIGQRVVCVDGNIPHVYTIHGVISPKKGNIYTIREVVGDTDYIGFKLMEINNKVQRFNEGHHEPDYENTRFRPLDEKRIDIFRAMLKNKEKEKVYDK